MIRNFIRQHQRLGNAVQRTAVLITFRFNLGKQAFELRRPSFVSFLGMSRKALL